MAVQLRDLHSAATSALTNMPPQLREHLAKPV
jgi:hypothetical protein